MAAQLRVLDMEALRILVTEDNSSKYAVDAHHRGLERLGDLSGMPKLYSLDVSFNEIKVLENLHTAKDLRELKAYNNKLTQASGLKGNQNLEILVLSDNAIEEMPGDLTALFKLKTLQLHGNRIARIDHLKACRHLTYLDLSRNRISGVMATGLQTLAALEYLNLSDNELTSIGNVENLKKLEEINVAGNKLTSLGGVYPTSLTVLRVDRNRISDITALPVLAALTELYLQGNAIDDVSVLVDRAPVLETLDIRNNRVRSTADLRALQAYATLEDLWLRGNPCTLSETYLVDVLDFVPTLQFLDDLTPQRIRDCPNPAKLVQDMASRPSTPGRPATPALSRPTSAGGTRPSTADGRPLMSRPSSRAGAPTKMLSPADVDKAQNEVRDRLEKLKQMMAALCGEPAATYNATAKPVTSSSAGIVAPTNAVALIKSTEVLPKGSQEVMEVHDSSVATTKSTEKPSKSLREGTARTGATVATESTERSVTNAVSVAGGADDPKAAVRPVTTTPRKAVSATTSPRPQTTPKQTHDMGTDPLEGNAIPIRTPATVTPRREAGNQSALDKAPASVEEAMKQELLARLVEVDDIVLDEAPVEISPRVDLGRRAECRDRPTAAERTGFRLFRIPASAKRFMQSTVAT
ncbi:protein phosphatase 1 regulatory subunit 7 [Achlya hypogyna]|uniref:Protein phosphatase 1 regulatory subunit 7 n=1 Tax=Achlya hypogyna TaxID=1202772 RepID=A0A1V9ZIJ4_ACHHY|nr:protein phosphatase 1 regulatory subunit 7 [Achlya hypogyna]